MIDGFEEKIKGLDYGIIITISFLLTLTIIVFIQLLHNPMFSYKTPFKNAVAPQIIALFEHIPLIIEDSPKEKVKNSGFNAGKAWVRHNVSLKNHRYFFILLVYLWIMLVSLMFWEPKFYLVWLIPTTLVTAFIAREMAPINYLIKNEKDLVKFTFPYGLLHKRIKIKRIPDGYIVLVPGGHYYSKITYTCNAISGFAEGIFDSFGCKFIVEEIECVSEGFSGCKFRILKNRNDEH